MAHSLGRGPSEPRQPHGDTLRPHDFAPPRFVVLRTPLLPFATLEAWGRDLHCANSPEDPTLHARDLARAREHMQGLLEDPIVREAILLASPSLWERRASIDDDVACASSFARYCSRMAARCTPFGLFAATSSGSIGSATCLDLSARASLRRHTRLDAEWLCALVEQLVADPALRAELRFVRNGSLVELGDRLHYAETRLRDGSREYFLVEAGIHDALHRALECARRPSTLAEIATAIEDEQIAHEVALAFADSLVDAQLLHAELGPVVTGDDALGVLIERLGDAPSAKSIVATLREVRASLHALDGDGVGAPVERYDELAAQLRTLLPVDRARMVQVDCSRPATGLEIPARVADELLRAAFALRDLFGYGFTDPLTAFREAFVARYEERSVPLGEVLDDEVGIGYQRSHAPSTDPSPLVAGLEFPAIEEAERALWGSRWRFLLAKLSETLRDGGNELRLDFTELERFHDASLHELPDALHVMATLLAPDDPDDAPWALLDSAGGPSGARLMARFCHVDPELERCVREHVAAEEALHPEIRHFELVHLPEGRTGNILARPVLREFELELLGLSGAPLERRLALDDVLITVADGRIVLHSRSLGCELRPRVSSAHNARTRSHPVYRFLFALQAEHRISGVQWTWGALDGLPRLPRVRIGKVLVARACWNLDASTLRSLQPRGHAGFQRMQTLRAELELPRWIAFVDGDNTLTVDLDNPLLVEALLDTLRGREFARLEEQFSGARSDLVETPEGRLANEILIPFVRTPESTRRLRPVPVLRESVPQSFAPGSEWLTTKFYGGAAVVDSLLQELVGPLLEIGRNDGWIDRWFFVRYGDPEWHLRVRWHGDGPTLCAQLLPRLHAALQPWLDDRRVHRLQLDGYTRESRRYGGSEAMLLAEEIFDADSEFARAYLTAHSDDAALDHRWRVTALGMDRLLADADLDLDARHALHEQLAELYAKEFQLDATLRQQLRGRYRDERAALYDLLGAAGTEDATEQLLRIRSERTRPLFAQLRALDARGELTVSLDEILASFLHMHANRMLRGSQRAHELVLHRFLEKDSASRLARGGRQQ